MTQFSASAQVMPDERDITRLFQELAAAPTRREAVEIFESADWIFLKMGPKEREDLYAQIEDIIQEKPE